jgi:hypothetical protein
VYPLAERLYPQLELSSTSCTADLCFSNLFDIITQSYTCLRKYLPFSLYRTFHTPVCNRFQLPHTLRLELFPVPFHSPTLLIPLHIPKNFCPASSSSSLQLLQPTSLKLNPSLPQTFKYISLLLTSLYHYHSHLPLCAECRAGISLHTLAGTAYIRLGSERWKGRDCECA